ncbi:MAG: putative lipid II flippase FtsW [Bacillota bacterium]
MDPILFATVLALVAFGLVMVFSSSSYSALVRFEDSMHYFRRQALWALFGLATMLVAQMVDYRLYRRHARVILFVGMFLLALSLVPGVGTLARGSRRAILLGPLSLSPAEVVKICLVVYLAHGMCRAPAKMHSFWAGVWPALMTVGAAVAMILLQPDLGTAIAVAGTAFFLLYAAGARVIHLIPVALLGAPAVWYLITSESYRMRRFLAFLNPWADPMGYGFHIIQSLYALGAGRLLGLGLGASHQKFLYLPEQHTDFIFAIVGEELGFLGSLVLVALFGVFLWRGLTTAARAPDAFASLLSTGITIMIVFQAFINIGVVTSILPVTGIPLPFISYGGSSLMVTMMSAGILLNISKYSGAREV